MVALLRGAVTVGIAVAAVVVVRTPALAWLGDVDVADTTPVVTAQLATPAVSAVLDCSPVQRSVDLSWPADPLDGEHDVEYEVLRDGVVIDTVDDPPYRDLVGLHGIWTYSVRAVLGPWTTPPAAGVTLSTDLICLP